MCKEGTSHRHGPPYHDQVMRKGPQHHHTLANLKETMSQSHQQERSHRSTRHEPAKNPSHQGHTAPDHRKGHWALLVVLKPPTPMQVKSAWASRLQEAKSKEKTCHGLPQSPNRSGGPLSPSKPLQDGKRRARALSPRDLIRLELIGSHGTPKMAALQVRRALGTTLYDPPIGCIGRTPARRLNLLQRPKTHSMLPARIIKPLDGRLQKAEGR